MPSTVKAWSSPNNYALSSNQAKILPTIMQKIWKKNKTHQNRKILGGGREYEKGRFSCQGAHCSPARNLALSVGDRHLTPAFRCLVLPPKIINFSQERLNYVQVRKYGSLPPGQCWIIMQHTSAFAKHIIVLIFWAN